MSKWLFALLVIPSLLSAQPRVPIFSVAHDMHTKTLTFFIRWVDPVLIDSTTIIVRQSADTSVILTRRVISPDTLILPLPDDTLTYRFELRSHRRGLTSAPAAVNFPFRAEQYYLLSRLRLFPDSVSIAPGETIQFCAFWVFNDSTAYLRERDAAIPRCSFVYDSLYGGQSARGYKQRYVNVQCLLWTATGGTLGEPEICG